MSEKHLHVVKVRWWLEQPTRELTPKIVDVQVDRLERRSWLRGELPAVAARRVAMCQQHGVLPLASDPFHLTSGFVAERVGVGPVFSSVWGVLPKAQNGP
jgi:hypothetical protein